MYEGGHVEWRTHLVSRKTPPGSLFVTDGIGLLVPWVPCERHPSLACPAWVICRRRNEQRQWHDTSVANDNEGRADSYGISTPLPLHPPHASKTEPKVDVSTLFQTRFCLFHLPRVPVATALPPYDYSQHPCPLISALYNLERLHGHLTWGVHCPGEVWRPLLEQYPRTGLHTLGYLKTPTQTRENPYPGHGCGFWWVRVRVALEYTRVTRDNP